MKLGSASLEGPDWPGGPPDGRGTVMLDGREVQFQFVDVGNPQLSIEMPDPASLAELDLGSVGPGLERDPRFPNRTNVSFWHGEEGRIRARIFERGAGETLSSGTGASGAAVAASIKGRGSRIEVALDGGELLVEIGPDRALTLTGWAIPVYSGEIDKLTMEALK